MTISKRLLVTCLAAAAGLTGATSAAIAAPAEKPAKVRPLSCSGTAYAPPFSGQYGDPGKADTSVFGSPGWKQGYSVKNETDLAGLAVQVRGFDDAGHEQWYGIGALAPGGHVEISVPWGNVVAYPEVRAAAPGSPGGKVSFNC